MSDLWAALCLVFVIEGLMLFAAPGFWKRNAEHLQAQRLGRSQWYGRYELRIARVERAYGGGAD